MKLLGTITIKAASRNDLKSAEEIIGKAVEDARLRINNGSRIKLGWTNGDDPSAMAALTGQLRWWSLGHPRETKHQKKGLLSMIGKELRSLYEDEPEI